MLSVNCLTQRSPHAGSYTDGGSAFHARTVPAVTVALPSRGAYMKEWMRSLPLFFLRARAQIEPLALRFDVPMGGAPALAGRRLPICAIPLSCERVRDQRFFCPLCLLAVHSSALSILCKDSSVRHRACCARDGLHPRKYPPRF